MFIYLVSSRVISWDHVQSVGIYHKTNPFKGPYHSTWVYFVVTTNWLYIIAYLFYIIQVWLRVKTFSNLAFTGNGFCRDTTRDLAGDSSRYQLFTPLHMRSRTVWEKKQLTQASASVNASAISWYNVKLQAFINVQCIRWSVDWRWQMAIWGQRNVSHSLIFHWWKMQQHCILA